MLASFHLISCILPDQFQPLLYCVCIACLLFARHCPKCSMQSLPLGKLLGHSLCFAPERSDHVAFLAQNLQSTIWICWIWTIFNVLDTFKNSQAGLRSHCVLFSDLLMFVAFCWGFPRCHIATLTCKWGAPELAACRAAVLAAEDAGTHRGAPAVAALRGVARGALCGEGRGVELWGEFVSW